MKLHPFTGIVPTSSGEALEEFEKEFTYPLGEGQRFRISHGDAYLRFFQAIGDPVLLAAEQDGEVLGTLVRVQRHLELRGSAESTANVVPAHLLCDLKVRTASRGSTTLARLIRETKRGIEASGNHSCYCVVMEGTGRLPSDYTGRLGVPRFEKLGEITILRLSSAGAGTGKRSAAVVSAAEFAAVHRSLGLTGYVATGGDSTLRSAMDPQRLVTVDHLACGLLEDTRRGKRLFLEGGAELLSAHLSGFAYATPQAGAVLLGEAVQRARDAGFPALFTAVPSGEWPRLAPELGGWEIQEAPATIYGHALSPGVDWWVDTAEI